jgi:hypothetical protein
MAQPCRNAQEENRLSRRVPTVPSHLPRELSKAMQQIEPGQKCAYNETRGCFLGLQVIGGEFTPSSFHDWLATLQPSSGASLWMIPFRGIPAGEVRTPLDLIYLDEKCRVIETVEFFPTFRVSPSCSPAASVLALPTHAIFSSQTQAGDQLIFGPANEIEWRLEASAKTGSAGAVRPAKTGLGPVLVRDDAKESARSLAFTEPSPPLASLEPSMDREQFVIRERARAAEPALAQSAPAVMVHEDLEPQAAISEEKPPVVAPKIQSEVQPAPEQPVAKPWLGSSRQAAPKGRNLLSRWLFADPVDPRKALRLPVPGLVAHFFTGGAPVPHAIRDVSATGLYVVTTERWYPGTVIRMTLSKPDTGQAPADRSITIQARSMRWGNDGVGLQFLVEARKKNPQPASLEPVDSAQLERFLQGNIQGER